jgi:hypothetical protein
MATDKTEFEENAEQALMTLEQLSQTLEVMTCVVDRLKNHLTRQLSLNAELFQDDAEKVRQAEEAERVEAARQLHEESLVVEITQREMEDGVAGSKKVVH